MSKQIQEQLDIGKARIVQAPASNENEARQSVVVDRTFEIPTGVYAATVGCYLAFIGTMFVAFQSPGLVIPMVIFALFVVAGFGVPTIWTRLKTNSTAMPLSWGKFAREGIMTNTGRLNAGEATIQILILPVLIVLWGLAAVTIAALV